MKFASPWRFAYPQRRPSHAESKSRPSIPGAIEDPLEGKFDAVMCNWSRQSTEDTDPFAPSCSDSVSSAEWEDDLANQVDSYDFEQALDNRAVGEVIGQIEDDMEEAGLSMLKSKIFGGLEQALASGALEEVFCQIAEENEKAELSALKVKMFKGFETASDNLSLEAVFKEIVKESDHAEPSMLKSRIFAGLEQALASGALEEVFGQIAEENEEAELLALKGKIFSGLEQALDNGALEAVFKEIARENESADLSALKSKIFKGFELALDNGALGAVLQQIMKENENAELSVLKGKFFGGLERTLDSGALEEVVKHILEDGEEVYEIPNKREDVPSLKTQMCPRLVHASDEGLSEILDQITYGSSDQLMNNEKVSSGTGCAQCDGFASKFGSMDVPIEHEIVELPTRVGKFAKFAVVKEKIKDKVFGNFHWAPRVLRKPSNRSQPPLLEQPRTAW